MLNRNNKPPYLLFDFDGTIADSFKLALSVLNEIGPKHGFHQITENELETLKGLTLRNILKKYQIAFYKFPQYFYEIKGSMRRHSDMLVPCKGIVEMLKKFAQSKIKMALFTSNSASVVMSFMKKNNIDVFDYYKCDIGYFRKARCLQKYRTQNGSDVYGYYYIGDEVRDIRAANKCGMPIIAVSWGIHTRELLCKYNPDYLVTTPDDLTEIFINN